jgi:hypothetical protein
LGDVGGAGAQQVSMFFFEKKNQKTFIRVPLALARAQANEVFFASFLFTKKKTLPCP